MKFPINYNGEEVSVDVTWWESTIDNRIEFYVVFAEHQETFINYVKRTDQLLLTEVSSSADLTEDIKAVIKESIVHFTQEHPYKF